MAKLELQPLKREHLDAAVYRPDHAEYVLALGAWNVGVEDSLVRNGGVALTLGDTVLAMAGAVFFWNGVGSIWMRTCVGAEQFPLAVVKATREFVRIIDTAFKPRRLQAHVRADSGVNRRFIERFGFREECVMRGFGPEGADYALYARVKE
jgi:hypothetical protein